MIRRNPLATLRQGPAACARAAQAPARQWPAASSGMEWSARQGSRLVPPCTSVHHGGTLGQSTRRTAMQTMWWDERHTTEGQYGPYVKARGIRTLRVGPRCWKTYGSSISLILEVVVAFLQLLKVVMLCFQLTLLLFGFSFISITPTEEVERYNEMGRTSSQLFNNCVWIQGLELFSSSK